MISGHSLKTIESLKGKRIFLGMVLAHAAAFFALLAMPAFYDVNPVM